MKLEEFIKKNEIQIGKEYESLCTEGISVMENAVDVNHDANHVLEMFSELDRLLEKEDIAQKLDFESLLPAICWHDVWISKRPQATGIPKLVYERTYEALGSALILRRYLKKNKIKLKKYWEIQKLVVFHADYKFVPFSYWVSRRLFNHPLELRVLKDIDFVAGLSLDRIRRITEKHIKKGQTDPLLFRAAFFYVDNFLIDRSPDLYFDSLNIKLKKNWGKIMRELVSVFNKIVNNKEFYFDTSDPSFKLVQNLKVDGKILELINEYSE